MVQLRLITKEDEMSNKSKTFYRDMRKKAHEFESREEFLNHDLKKIQQRHAGMMSGGKSRNAKVFL